MRTATLIALFLGLMTSPARAIPGDGHGGGKPKSPATLHVVNQCDGGVEVNVEGFVPFTLEPGESTDLSINMKGSKVNKTINANLAGSPSISDQENCQLQSGLTTIATITCATGASGTTLAITCLKPGQVAGLNLSRESSVVLASSSGLLSLLFFGCLLGRAPRRYESIEAGHSD